MHHIFIFLTIVEAAEADIEEDQQDQQTVSSEDISKKLDDEDKENIPN